MTTDEGQRDMRIILIGLPGNGKRTQAQHLAERLGVPCISAGDLFRENLRATTLVGLEARGHMDAGELVPDQITTAMVRERLRESDAARGFVLDGFPRTVPQAEALSRLLGAQGVEIDLVVELVVHREVIVRRLLDRGRSDDTGDLIRRREQVYWADTAPLLGYYRDLVVTVDADGLVDQVTGRILATLNAQVSISGGR